MIVLAGLAALMIFLPVSAAGDPNEPAPTDRDDVSQSICRAGTSGRCFAQRRPFVIYFSHVDRRKHCRNQ